MANKTFKLRGFKENFFLVKETYSTSGAIAVTLMCQQKGYEEEFMTISINLDKNPLDGFWVKNYGGGEDVISALENEGFLERTGQVTSTGFVTVPSMTLTAKAREFILQDS